MSQTNKNDITYIGVLYTFFGKHRPSGDAVVTRAAATAVNRCGAVCLSAC
jgi:hypothetical protein